MGTFKSGHGLDRLAYQAAPSAGSAGGRRLDVQPYRAMHRSLWKLRPSSCGSSGPLHWAIASTAGAFAGLVVGTNAEFFSW
jgi:hypothetical protein